MNNLDKKYTFTRARFFNDTSLPCVFKQEYFPWIEIKTRAKVIQLVSNL